MNLMKSFYKSIKITFVLHHFHRTF